MGAFFDKEPLLVPLSDRAGAPPIPRLYYSRYHGSKKGVYRPRIVPASKCTTEPQQADSGQPGLKNLQTAHEFSPVHKIQHQCHGKRSGFAERQLWEYVLSAYGTEEFTTKRLEKDFGNAAYATIRAFVMKFASLGLLKSRKAGNKSIYRTV